MSAKVSEPVQLCDNHPFPWDNSAPKSSLPARTHSSAATGEGEQRAFAWVKPATEELLEQSIRSWPSRYPGAFERDHRTGASGRYDPFVYKVPDKALRPMAEEYAFKALQFRRRAIELEERDARRAAAEERFARFPALAEPVYQHIQQGKTTEEAIIAVALKTDVLVETVRFYWKRSKLMAKITRANRNREIMRLAARGWTNAAIAKRVDMHPKSISRIIQRQLATVPPAPANS
jgi:hypothetical protein